MRLDRSVLFEGQFSPNQSVIELAGFHLKRLHIAGDLLLTAEVHDFEGASTLSIGWAADNDTQMWLDGVWNRLRRCHRELDSCQINSRGWAFDLTEFDVLDEERGDDVHTGNVAGVHCSVTL